MNLKKRNTKCDTQLEIKIDDYYNEAVWPGKLPFFKNDCIVLLRTSRKN